MSRSQILIGLALVSFGVGVTLVALFVWMTDPFYLKAPSDDRLVALFRAHRAEFDALREMALEDWRTSTYIRSSTLERSGLDKSRRDSYRRLLSTIDSGNLIITVDHQSNSVRFISATGGIAAFGPGWLKGIEYFPEKSDREGLITENLDSPSRLTAGVYLKPIEPMWFILFQKTD